MDPDLRCRRITARLQKAGGVRRSLSRDHRDLAIGREHDKIRFRDRPKPAAAQDFISRADLGPVSSRRKRQATTPATRTCTNPISARTLDGWPPAVPTRTTDGCSTSAKARAQASPINTRTSRADAWNETRTAEHELVPELDHAAPEMGHPLHLHRQPAHAHARAAARTWWVSEVEAGRPAWSTTTGWKSFNVNGTLTGAWS